MSVIAFPNTKPLKVISTSDPTRYPEAIPITGDLPDKKYIDLWEISGTTVIVLEDPKQTADARSQLSRDWLAIEGEEADLTGQPGAKPWITGPMTPYYDAANLLLDQGRKAAAVDMIERAPVPNGLDPTQTAIFEGVRGAMANAVSQLLI